MPELGYIMEKLRKLGINENTEICFEKICRHAIFFSGFEKVDDIRGYYRAKEDYIFSVLMNYAEKGVEFISLDGVVISPFANIGSGTVIYPNVQIRSGVHIGDNCVIGSGTVIERSSVGNGCVLNAVQIYDSLLEDDVRIGPFSHIRPGSHIRSGVRIGDFVEVKNSDIGENTHASHLTYIGDSDVGKRVNFGCGTVTVNYDGISKNRTVIGDDAFIGCNTNLVAPVKIGDRAFTAAGSTIVEDVESDSLGIARSRQVNKPGWVKKRRSK